MNDVQWLNDWQNSEIFWIGFINQTEICPSLILRLSGWFCQFNPKHQTAYPIIHYDRSKIVLNLLEI